jgi:hypothetical protein
VLGEVRCGRLHLQVGSQVGTGAGRDRGEFLLAGNFSGHDGKIWTSMLES